MLKRVVDANLPTKYGDFVIHGYTNEDAQEHHIALTMGEMPGCQPVLVRIHSECLTGDALGSAKCDCGDQYEAAMVAIQKQGRGVLVYLRQEGRGIGLINKLKAYSLQDDKGLDTVEANLALGFAEDARDYEAAVDILRDLGALQLRLLTNNPHKITELERRGLNVVERVPIETEHKAASETYMNTKKYKMGHLLETY